MPRCWPPGGPKAAEPAHRLPLRAFWLDVSQQSSPLGGCFGAPASLSGFNLDLNPFYAWTQQFTRWFSPYQFSRSGDNALREVLQRHVKPQVLTAGPLALFITATSVRTGQARVFDCRDLSIDALLASACCRTSSAPSRSRASPIGTAATAAIRPCGP